MEKKQNIVSLILKAVAVGMSVASIGMFALAVAALQKEE